MKKIYLLVILFSLNALPAQPVDHVLDQILKNNQELKAVNELNKLVVLNSKNELLPENPEFEQEFKENDNYEVGITQSFQFPTDYYHQYKKLQLTKTQQEKVFRAARIKILTDAKIHLYRMACLEQQINIQSDRLEKAVKLTEYFEKMLTEGEITQLALNQAKIHKITYENRLNDLLAEKVEIEQTLKLLNGGKELDIKNFGFGNPVKWIDTANLREEYLRENPELQLAQINRQIADRNTKIAKYSWLPDLRLGVHKEKETGPFLHYGISVPLWKRKNKVARAKIYQNYQQTNQRYTMQTVRSEIDRLLQQYHLLKNKYQTNLNLRQELNSEALLRKSLKVREISVIEYFTELEKLYNFEDEFLKTKLDLLITTTLITSYRL